MHTLGFDVGSSFVKGALVNTSTGTVTAAASYPDHEMPIHSPIPGWAEQDPESWWTAIKHVVERLDAKIPLRTCEIGGIGISYQMHGLVIADAQGQALRPSIIWCDSRASDIGRKARLRLGERFCREHVLNSPGNFTASKARWVIENEADLFSRAAALLLPGDFIALRMTGEMTTTAGGLSEGILWDFLSDAPSREVLRDYGIDEKLLPRMVPTLGRQGALTTEAANNLGLKAGIPVTYRAGDQPNNAFSLNVIRPGDIAATAGTSGVVFAVGDVLKGDPQSRVNAFAHVNHTAAKPRIGTLLCINGTGIANSWMRRHVGDHLTYDQMNAAAAHVPVGANGVVMIPFGNGAERMFGDREIGASISGLSFNRHDSAEIFRAVHEGVAFAFAYGIEILSSLGISPRVMKAGNANLFLSPIFRQTLADVTGIAIELFNTDGAQGAARAAAVGAGLTSIEGDAFRGLTRIGGADPGDTKNNVRDTYQRWRSELEHRLAYH